MRACDRHVARSRELTSPTVRIWSRHTGVADAPGRAEVELGCVRQLERVHWRANLRRHHALFVDQTPARALSLAYPTLLEAIVPEACAEDKSKTSGYQVKTLCGRPARQARQARSHTGLGFHVVPRRPVLIFRSRLRPP